LLLRVVVQAAIQLDLQKAQARVVQVVTELALNP
jgi:hypothetical protein